MNDVEQTEQSSQSNANGSFQPPVDQTQTSPEFSGPPKTKKVLLIGLITLVVAITGVIVYFLLFSNGDKSTVTNTNQNKLNKQSNETPPATNQLADIESRLKNLNSHSTTGLDHVDVFEVEEEDKTIGVKSDLFMHLDAGQDKNATMALEANGLKLKDELEPGFYKKYLYANDTVSCILGVADNSVRVWCAENKNLDIAKDESNKVLSLYSDNNDSKSRLYVQIYEDETSGAKLATVSAISDPSILVPRTFFGKVDDSWKAYGDKFSTPRDLQGSPTCSELEKITQEFPEVKEKFSNTPAIQTECGEMDSL